MLKLFKNCMREGKLTISMRLPEHDIFIKKADPWKLERFAFAINLAITGAKAPEGFDKEPTVKFTPTITKMSITQRSEYPVRGFPDKLTSLRIANIKMCRIQTRILELANLVDLAVENNLLEEVPKSFASLRLVSLSLQQNKIRRVYDIFSGVLGTTLKVLNLSHNEIGAIPYSLCRTRLQVLDLSHNQLATLPPSFHGGDQMKTLRLNDNQLRYLPANLRVKSAEVTLRNNPELTEAVLPVRASPEPMNLLDLAGRAVHQAFPVSRVTVDDAIPHLLYPYLLSFVPCGGCGRLTFPSPDRRTLKEVHVLDFAMSMVLGMNDNGLVRKADIRCSVTCARAR